MSQKIVILGATSKIALEFARLAAAAGKELLVVARRPERLAAVSADLAARGAAHVDSICLDLADISGHAALVEEILAKMPEFDTVLLAYSTLGEQEQAEGSAEYALAELNTNFTSAVSLLTRLSKPLEKRGAGCIAGIASVAGDRARRSNYVYGTAKGALALFLQGLRAKLYESGVRVVTFKPGRVSTPMTAHMPNHHRFADPAAVARVIFREVEEGRRDIVYVPWYWRWVMLVIRLIPERIGKRLKF